MSQKDQEAAIDERIERIRKRNEEIQRRYLEVEADKRNAEKLNAAVKFAPPDVKNVERKPFSRPLPVNRNPKFERKTPDKPYIPKPQPHGKKYSDFPDGDGPPPDPVYTFLSDHSRDQPRGDNSPDANVTKDDVLEDEFRGPRGRGRGRGWARGRGSPGRGGRRGGGNNQSPRRGPQMQPEYQAWRAEREKIDEARITRQKTAEGNWRREWDSEKISQDENQEYQARPVFSKKKKRDDEEMKIQRTVVNDLAITTPPSKTNDSKHSDKPIRCDYHDKDSPGEKKTMAFNFREGASYNETDDDPEEHLEFEHRNIISFGDSIKISLSNKPIKSVRVNPMNAAGTGRVGPRQKPRLSYSSQSEDEKEIHAPIIRKRTPAVNLNESQHTKIEAAKKPPLPPTRIDKEHSSPKKKQTPVNIPVMVFGETETLAVERKELSRDSSRENVSEGGDDSWEDVATTSGNESADYSDGEATRSDEGGKAFIKGKIVDSTIEGGVAVIGEVSDEAKAYGQGKGESSDESYGEPEEISEVFGKEVKNVYDEVSDVAKKDADNVDKVKEKCMQIQYESTAESTKELVYEEIRLDEQYKLPSEELILKVPTENESPRVNEGSAIKKEECLPAKAADEVNISSEASLKTSCEDEVKSNLSIDNTSTLQSEPSSKYLESVQTESGCLDSKDVKSDKKNEMCDESEVDEKGVQRSISGGENFPLDSPPNDDTSP